VIIDLILDRRDDESRDNFNYNAHDFYFNVLQYGEIGDNITDAMDYGTEANVKKALCKYIDNNFYNPLIKNYINARQWLTNTSEKKPIVPIL
jgi:hypothetical protein